MTKKKRDFRSLSWEHNTVEEYDLVRHFVELNNKFPNNTVFVGNEITGFISYKEVSQELKSKGAEIVFKSDVYNGNIRKEYYVLNDDFILIESNYNRPSNTFNDLKPELATEHYIVISAQITILHSSEIVDEYYKKLIDSVSYLPSVYPTVGIISRDNNGFFLNEMVLDVEICKDLNLHYGEGFDIFHNSLIKRLSEKNKGISLLHGIPGSGKSYYINRLIFDLKEITDKKIILVPTNMVSYLLEPDFTTFLMELINDGTDYEEDEYESDIVDGIIFILEDAEPVLMKREESMSPQSTSNILNLTDGLLNSIFKIQIIATYNTDDENIDPAIKRDKRLICKRKFGNLTLEESKKLAKHLDIEEAVIIKPMSVAEIYSLNDKDEDEILIDDKRNIPKTGKAGLKLN